MVKAMSGSEFREHLFLDARESATFDELAAQFEYSEEHLIDLSLLPRIYRS